MEFGLAGVAIRFVKYTDFSNQYAIFEIGRLSNGELKALENAYTPQLGQLPGDPTKGTIQKKMCTHFFYTARLCLYVGYMSSCDRKDMIEKIMLEEIDNSRVIISYTSGNIRPTLRSIVRNTTVFGDTWFTRYNVDWDAKEDEDAARILENHEDSQSTDTTRKSEVKEGTVMDFSFIGQKISFDDKAPKKWVDLYTLLYDHFAHWCRRVDATLQQRTFSYSNKTWYPSGINFYIMKRNSSNGKDKFKFSVFYDELTEQVTLRFFAENVDIVVDGHQIHESGYCEPIISAFMFDKPKDGVKSFDITNGDNDNKMEKDWRPLDVLKAYFGDTFWDNIIEIFKKFIPKQTKPFYENILNGNIMKAWASDPEYQFFDYIRSQFSILVRDWFFQGDVKPIIKSINEVNWEVRSSPNRYRIELRHLIGVKDSNGISDDILSFYKIDPIYGDRRIIPYGLDHEFGNGFRSHVELIYDRVRTKIKQFAEERDETPTDKDDVITLSEGAKATDVRTLDKLVSRAAKAAKVLSAMGIKVICDGESSIWSKEEFKKIISDLNAESVKSKEEKKMNDDKKTEIRKAHWDLDATGIIRRWEKDPEYRYFNELRAEIHRYLKQWFSADVSVTQIVLSENAVGWEIQTAGDRKYRAELTHKTDDDVLTFLKKIPESGYRTRTLGLYELDHEFGTFFYNGIKTIYDNIREKRSDGTSSVKDKTTEDKEEYKKIVISHKKLVESVKSKEEKEMNDTFKKAAEEIIAESAMVKFPHFSMSKDGVKLVTLPFDTYRTMTNTQYGMAVNIVKDRSTEIRNAYWNADDGTATIIWADGSKTIARTMKGTTPDPEIGFAICIAKKMMGGTQNKWRKWLKGVVDASDASEKKKNSKAETKLKKQARTRLLEEGIDNPDSLQIEAMVETINAEKAAAKAKEKNSPVKWVEDKSGDFWTCQAEGCGLTNDAGAKFCIACGAAKPKMWKCGCGAVNAHIAQYCAQCGKIRKDLEPVAEEPVETPKKPTTKKAATKKPTTKKD